MGGRKQMRASQMTLQQFKAMLDANKERLHYFWKYATEQRRGVATSVKPSTIKQAMQRRKAK